ncbi:MAG: hypothetical protein QF791_01065 [Nitrospinaceae bacterium]|jgi:hypothetical protein|nr:hypothetical protein [Nitrospinaceae bacterium]|tara:strand:+ start:503 stop:1078 length:576 start_codon:yes stop_codon:yes gene_type:complete
MVQRAMISAILAIFLVTPPIGIAASASECKPVEKKKVKVEGFISKEFKKDRKKIFKEFAEMGHTRTALRVFPMGKTSDVVGMGRCVPAYIARHVLVKAIEYTGGVGNLVVQDFLPEHWIGIGTTMFDEPSQQKVSAEQVQQLLNPDLGDKEFHALYRKFSVQDELVPFFGLKVPNAKIPGASTILQKNKKE